MASMGQDLERLQAAYRAAPSSRRFAPLADAYRESGRLAEALEILERGVAAHPSYVSALVLMAQCQLELGRDAEAEESFARVVELDPENLAAMKYRAERAAGRGDKSQALLLLDRVLEIDPWDREARRLRVELERVALQAPSEPEPASWLVEPELELLDAEAAPVDEIALPLVPEAPAEIPEAEIPIVDLERIGAAPEPLDLVQDPGSAEPHAEVEEPEPPRLARTDMAATWGVERLDDRIVVRPRQTEAELPPAELAEHRDEVPRGADEFSTLTLARIYESQGYFDRALAIYDELHRRHPENVDVAERLRALQGRLAGVEHPVADEPGSAPTTEAPPESASWRLLDPAALGDAPAEPVELLRDLAAQVRDRDLARRHTFIGAPPDADAAPRHEPAAAEPAPPEEPDFERFLRYVRSLKR